MKLGQAAWLASQVQREDAARCPPGWKLAEDVIAWLSETAAEQSSSDAS